jgi:LPXTG-motif cell wall-anchored protein
VTVSIALDGATLPPATDTNTGTNVSTRPAAVATTLADTGSAVVPLTALGMLLLVSGAGLLRARHRTA